MTATSDVQQTGASDIPWDAGVQGNPPEGSYLIVGVADRVKDVQLDHGAFKSYTMTLRNHQGREQPVEWLRKADSPAPRVGDTVEGTVTPSQNPKYPPKFKQAQKGGGGGRGGWGGNQKNDRSIEAQVAAKGGVEIAIAAATGQPTDAATLTQNAVAAARALHAAIRDMAA